jgi:uncharacterized protein YcaQ
VLPLPDVASALTHLGYVQIDPINVCGRMQDHILRQRVQGYTEHGLMQHVHAEGTRTALEHHLPNSHTLVALPAIHWPYLQRAMAERTQSESVWLGAMSAEEETLAKRILAQMKANGALCSQDIVSERKAKSHAWDSTTLAKSTLQKMFFHGRVLIARRDGSRRYYDLPERVLPASVLRAKTPTVEQTQRWSALLTLQQRRLVALKPTQLRLIGDYVTAVNITDAAGPTLHCLRNDVPLWNADETRLSVRLIAPLDPMIYDRAVTEMLWDFHYRWEVYTPPLKRVRGYYALPILSQYKLVGHVDAKADRVAGRLNVVSKEVRHGHSATKAVKELAAFLSLW